MAGGGGEAGRSAFRASGDEPASRRQVEVRPAAGRREMHEAMMKAVDDPGRNLYQMPRTERMVVVPGHTRAYVEPQVRTWRSDAVRPRR